MANHSITFTEDIFSYTITYTNASYQTNACIKIEAKNSSGHKWETMISNNVILWEKYDARISLSPNGLFKFFKRYVDDKQQEEYLVKQCSPHIFKFPVGRNVKLNRHENIKIEADICTPHGSYENIIIELQHIHPR